MLFNQTGIPQESSYPYAQKASYYRNFGSPICTDSNRIRLSSTITSLNFYNSVGTETLQQFLNDYGPITVGVNAYHMSFLYAGSSGGI